MQDYFQKDIRNCIFIVWNAMLMNSDISRARVRVKPWRVGVKI
jgi:hypothetical protein